MKIDVWSDFVCPFCYIGKRRLELALEQFPHRSDVEVEFKSFELDPNAPVYSGKTIHEAIASKYGMSLKEAKENNAYIGEQAESVGLSFDFESMKPTNTFDAHRLSKFAKAQGKEKAITDQLLHAYFAEGKLLSDADTLLDIAEASGLERQEALAVLNDKKAYASDVRIDEALAAQYRITGVPYFIINEKYTISGAQPLETFLEALQMAWEEEHPAPKFQSLTPEGSFDAFCADGFCAIPPTKE